MYEGVEKFRQTMIKSSEHQESDQADAIIALTRLRRASFQQMNLLNCLDNSLQCAWWGDGIRGEGAVGLANPMMGQRIRFNEELNVILLKSVLLVHAPVGEHGQSQKLFEDALASFKAMNYPRP